MGTKVNLIITTDFHSEEFPMFTGLIPRVGESVVYYSRTHDGCQYTGVVTNVHHRIEFAQQGTLYLDTIQTIHVTITEKKPQK